MRAHSSEAARPKRGSLDLGKGKPAQADAAKIEMLNGAFAKVVEAVSPCVVSVNTEKKWSEQDKQQIFPTGRSWARELDYPEPELSRVPDGTVESFAGVANHWLLGRIEPSFHSAGRFATQLLRALSGAGDVESEVAPGSSHGKGWR